MIALMDRAVYFWFFRFLKVGNMKVIRKKSLKNKLKRVALDTKFSRSIYSNREFTEILNYERVRADRIGSVFSVTLFSSEDLYKTKNYFNHFITELKTQIRLIDHAGWYDKDYVAVLLPETDADGAVILGNKIINNIDFVNGNDSAFEVYTYPDNWLEKGVNTLSEKSSKEKRNKGMNISARIEDLFTIKMPVWKRVLDIAGSSLGLLAASPLFLFLGLYIKAVSPGPVFYNQKRVGYRGREFNFWKFRTMKVDNSVSSHSNYFKELINSDKPMEKLDEKRDPRIILGGKVIRKSCIDELPQLWNVLKGEMSLVGPRPCIPYEAEEYLRWHTYRFDVVPGLTGLWQVSGKNKLSFREMISLDIYYSRNLSLLLDLKIISVTIPAIIMMILEAVFKKFNIEKKTDGRLESLT